MKRRTAERSTKLSSADERERVSFGFLLTATMLLVGLLASGFSGLLVPSDGSASAPNASLTVWPQKWNFFIGLATGDVVIMYHIDGDGTLGNLEFQRERWTDDDWGLSRHIDAPANELGTLAVEIPQRYWQRCQNARPAGCRVRLGAAAEFRVGNPRTFDMICGGPAAVALERPEPTAAGRLPSAPRAVYRVAVVEIPCER